MEFFLRCAIIAPLTELPLSQKFVTEYYAFHCVCI